MKLVVQVIAPTGRDAGLVVGALQRNGIAAAIWNDVSVLSEDLHDEPLGPLLIAEEALKPPFVTRLGEWLQRQPTWSDLPILILTGNNREISPNHLLEYERLRLGAPVLLERPIRTATLVSSVRAALRARQRQYEIRNAFKERDDALMELRQERETLHVLLDNLPVGVLLGKPSGEIILANRSVEAILGHPPLAAADIASHGNWVTFHPDGRRVKEEEYPLVRAMKTGQTVPPENYLYQCEDGTLSWISLAAAPIFNDREVVVGGVVAISDIDKQKRADSELRKSSERFRRLIENASVGIIIGDLKGAISYANPTILRLLGYTTEEIESGLSWNELTPVHYVEADRRAIEQLRATGTADSYQKEYRSKDGRLIPLMVGATIIPSQTSSIGSDEVAIFLTDMSSQKQAEFALVQSEKLAAVGRLAASISHEINNPLEAVTNILYLACLQDGMSSELRNLLDTADQELRRVSQIVAHTLRFHRQSTKPRAITAEELIEPTLGLYQGRLTNSQIGLQLQHRKAGSVTCYEGDIRQVLNNLIGNAIDSMRTGGCLVIRTSNSRLRKTNKHGVRITIADSGHGMSPDVLKHIFDAFYTTKGINGTGLGLWISLGIIEKHHGRLQVRSRTGEGKSGAVFSLFLPSESL